MISDYFTTKVLETFKGFEKKHRFSVRIGKDHITYQCRPIRYTIFLDHYSEIYLSFDVKNRWKREHLRLEGLIQYLNEEKNMNFNLSGNQVSNPQGVDLVLKNLFAAMDSILKMIFNDRTILQKALQYQYANEQKRHAQYWKETISLGLQNEWESKNYKGLIEFYEKQKQKEKNIDLYLSELQKRQIEYARRYK